MKVLLAYKKCWGSLFLVFFSIFLLAQDVKESEWKGFRRHDFTFENKNAYIVFPDKPLDGKPWVWRARFPEWHTEMDEMLLAEGFHIVYINTDNMYGSPRAVEVWSDFYQFLVKNTGLNEKVALEGVSRGGLFIYNWAKENPEKVNCIYAEGPVCDFKSWPGGFGDGLGSPSDWEKLKKEYGFQSDEEAKVYDNQPFDKLDKLAKAKVPVLHMVSLNDSVVPSDENTFLLIDRYLRLGGIASIVPCTQSPQKLHGHHYNIETPRLGADFIKYFSIP